MYKCKVIYASDFKVLEERLNEWFDFMKDTRMASMDLKYAMNNDKASVLITWFETEES